MIRRLVIGLLKGLVVGGAIGAGLHFGLLWTTVPVALGYLLAMGAGGTTGIFAGRPPWQENAWIEAILKGLVGVGLGALAYWGLTYIPFAIPFPGVAEATGVAGLPLVFAPLISGTYGALVELDNTGAGADAIQRTATKARVADDDALAVEVPARGSKKGQAKKA